MAFDPVVYMLSVIGILCSGFALSSQYDIYRRRRDLLYRIVKGGGDSPEGVSRYSTGQYWQPMIKFHAGLRALLAPVLADCKRAAEIGALKISLGVSGAVFLCSVLIIFIFLKSFPIALVVACLISGGGFYGVIQFKLGQNEDAILKSLPDLIDGLIRCLRTGFDLNRALTIMASETHTVLRHELRILIRNRDLGQPLSDAAFAMAEKLRNAEVLYLATLIAVQERSGGPLVDALSSLSRILKDRERLRQKRMVASAEARMSALILGGLPAIVALSLFATNASYRDVLINTQSGRLFLALAMTLAAIGSFIMYRMIRIGAN